MKVIYGFKQMDEHYKPFNEDFVRLAKLSVKSAKKYYKTKFYCDSKSLEFFNDNEIFFDEVVVINDFIDDFPTQFPISKIYGMMNETEPFILLDFDVVLLEEINPTHTITYGHPEVQLVDKFIGLDVLLYTHEHYLKPFNEHIRKYFNNEDLSKVDWITYPSFCLVAVKNPMIIKSIYKNIIETISKEDISMIPPMLFEQFLCHQQIIKHNVDYGFLSLNHYYNDGDFDPIKMISKKYVHLHINKKNIKEEITFLEGII
jgi:hypothetical protein